MIRFACRTIFRISTFRHSEDILVHDPPPFDRMPYDIPPNGLKENVSGLLQIPYLSKYQKSFKELKEKFKYEGKIIGNLSRLFFSIPTARDNSSEFYYVHYLLNTGSPHTTLTHQALCCLYGKKVDDPNIRFPGSLQIIIGSRNIQVHLSNPYPGKENPTQNYRNVNLLGMNFLRDYDGGKLVWDFQEDSVTLELIE